MNHKEYGTHSVKTFNANIKQLPIVANLVGAKTYYLNVQRAEQVLVVPPFLLR